MGQVCSHKIESKRQRRPQTGQVCKMEEWDYINESHYESPAESLDQSCMINFGSRVICAVNKTEINTSLLLPPLPPIPQNHFEEKPNKLANLQCLCFFCFVLFSLGFFCMYVHVVMIALGCFFANSGNQQGSGCVHFCRKKQEQGREGGGGVHSSIISLQQAVVKRSH